MHIYRNRYTIYQMYFSCNNGIAKECKPIQLRRKGVFAKCLEVMPKLAIRDYLHACNKDVTYGSTTAVQRRSRACAAFEAFVYDCENNNYDVGTIHWREGTNCGKLRL